MGSKQRDKGIRGELEAAKVLEPALGPLARTLVQCRTGGEAPDIDGPNCRYAIEIKNQKAPNPGAAWEQARSTADDRGDERVPIAMTKGTRRPWLVTLPADEFVRLVRASRQLPLGWDPTGSNSDEK